MLKAIELNDKLFQTAGSLRSLEKILKRSPEDANATNAEGRRILACCALSSAHDCIKFLLKNGHVTEINHTDSKDQTALHLACKVGSKKCAQLLLDAGANPSITDKDGNTPLLIACMNNQTACAEILVLRTNPDINHQNNEGNTAMHYAALPGPSALCKLLLELNPNLSLSNNEGKTALFIGKEHNQYKSVALIERHSSKLAGIAAIMSDSSKSLKSAADLIEAAKVGDLDDVVACIEAGVDTDSTGMNDTDKKTASSVLL